VNGKAIFYADTITRSMRETIDETNRRRAKQMAYNKKHGIVPKPIVKKIGTAFDEVYDPKVPEIPRVAENDFDYLTDVEVKKKINEYTEKMKKAAMELNFLEAAEYRDLIEMLKKKLKRK
jgi:excinuclease ABC subunit B